MLAAPEIFSDDDIIDEIVDFLAAGTQTTQRTTQVVLYRLMTQPEILKRVRTEFEELVGTKSSFSADFKEELTYEVIRDMKVLGCVFQETLRLNPVAPISSFQEVAKDTKFGWLSTKANQQFSFNISGLHLNGNQWQRPFEFLPDRFDPNHELSRTPDGKKRNPYSWLPFLGGRRICMGKHFAEIISKAVSTMMTQRFEMCFENKELYNADRVPRQYIGIRHRPPIWVEIRLRDNQ